ncbi:CotH kinase family protein [Candidatus Sumerlaeota bacterium]|nr:CotH kinase family protein [Candidatus Sumerlaeota bacterium]
MLNAKDLLAICLSALVCVSIRGADSDIVINEIYYHAPSGDESEEFLELYNRGASAVDLNGWSFNDGIEFTFTTTTLMQPGDYLCLAPDLAVFSATHGSTIPVAGPYTLNLSNGGETVQLVNGALTVIDIVSYMDGGDWPSEPDGGGPSLELYDPASDNSLAGNWRASLSDGGTPGALNSSGQAPPPVIYASDEVLEFELIFAQADWWSQMIANISSESYIAADFRFNGQTWTDVGVRFKGNSSLSNDPNQLKKPFKIDFNEFTSGQSFYGYDKIILNNCFADPTFMREKIMSDIANDYIETLRVGYANLTISGTSPAATTGTLWGLYTNVEEVDEEFLQSRFTDDEGNLFKGDPHGILAWLGIDQANYETQYELKTNEAANDWSDLIALIDVINNSSDGDLSALLPLRLDVETALWYAALHNVFANLDSYVGSGHNYYIYHHTGADTFIMIPWDLNESFGAFPDGGMNVDQIVNISIFYHVNASRPLLDAMLNKVPEWRESYKDKIQALLDGPFRVSAIQARIDALHALIDSAVAADPNKLYTYQMYLDNQQEDVTFGGDFARTVPGLIRFVHDRRIVIAYELSGVAPPPTNVIINEVMYFAAGGSALEYVELYNPTNEAIDLSGMRLASDPGDGVALVFPGGTIIEPGGFVVATNDAAALHAAYGDVGAVFGDFTFGLNNAGDEVILFPATGEFIDQIFYTATAPWPEAAAGLGPSMELISPRLDNALGENWSASLNEGTPGAPNSVHQPSLNCRTSWTLY